MNIDEYPCQSNASEKLAKCLQEVFFISDILFQNEINKDWNEDGIDY